MFFFTPSFVLATLALVLPAVLFAAGLLTSPQANGRQGAQRAAGLSAVVLLLALLLAVGSGIYGSVAHVFAAIGPIQLSVYLDVLSIIMLVLIAFLAAVILRYSVNYLDGDPGQARFTRWMCLTIGCVLTLVVSGNLLLFTLAWIGTSLTLQRLLTFYPDRPGALLAARKKFLISRLGDVALCGVLILTYQCFGTWDFREIFALARTFSTSEIPPQIGWISLLMVAGAMMKSAQFPFHSWLPDTMETPTPVSALMHAGIINAGGFLLVRLSPVVAHSPTVLNALALIGAFTALFASLIMLTQTSIKRSLAYSTIAQMGFMMLQIGLGAFALAILHIVAHSLYKAHAFLTSGSIVNLAKSSWVPTERPSAHPIVLVAILITSVALTWGMAQLFGVHLDREPGILLLGSVYLMALTYFFWNLWASSHQSKLVLNGFLIGIVASAAYFGLHVLFVSITSDVMPSVQLAHGPVETAVMGIILLTFLAVLVIQAQFPVWSSTRLGRALYVHAYKGFYFVTLANRITLALTPRKATRSSTAP